MGKQKQNHSKISPKKYIFLEDKNYILIVILNLLLFIGKQNLSQYNPVLPQNLYHHLLC